MKDSMEDRDYSSLAGSTKNIVMIYDFMSLYEIEANRQALDFLSANDGWSRTRYNYEAKRWHSEPKSLISYEDMNSSICRIASYEFGMNLKPYGSRGNCHMWEEGDSLEVHSDSETVFCAPQDVATIVDMTWPTSPIQITALVYLNDDFVGGEIRFPKHGITISPRAGALLLFPSGCMYPHEVLPITSGRRYTYSVFLSNSALIDSFIEMRTMVVDARNDR
jgi:predicted 2-oxoglutarate/Fe(II)-dependent dioxygenase YbiX